MAQKNKDIIETQKEIYQRYLELIDYKGLITIPSKKPNPHKGNCF